MAENLWIVILAGGVGSRFWPVSTPDRPKQLLPLAGDLPLIRQTVDRVLPMVPRERIRILTGERLARPVLDALPGFDASNLLIEPAARGTEPVLAWAAHEIARGRPDAVMISLHADHVIQPAESFRRMLGVVAGAALRHDRLFTIGAVPTRAETGYGYIRAGDALDEAEGLLEVAEFVEKPDAATAGRYVREGYLWNTGLFVLPVGLFLDEVRTCTPEVARHLALLDAANVTAFFERCPTITIDTGLMERSRKVAVARATFDWDDVGTWDALSRTRPPDERGNVSVGETVAAVESDRCVIWAEDGPVVAFGVRDLVIVRTRDVTFVAPRERAPDLKELLNRLPDDLARPGGS